MAGPLARRLAAPVSMSGGEWRTADLRRREPAGADESVLSYYRSLGCSDTDARAYIDTRAAGTRNMTDLPDDHAAISEGEEIRLAGRQWQVMTGGGHSPEHEIGRASGRERVGHDV